MREAISRADLLRALSSLEDRPAPGIARFLGFEPDPTWRPAPKAPGEEEERPNDRGVGPESPPAQEPKSRRRFAPVPLWRWATAEASAERVGSETGPSPNAAVALEEKDLCITSRAPSPPPLVSRSRLRRRLENELQTPQVSQHLDLARAVEQLAQGKSLESLPYLSGLHAARIALILDSSLRLLPFHDDFVAVACWWFRRLGEERVRLLPGPETETIPSLRSDEIVLALSDLGFYGEASERSLWRAYGQRLRSAGGQLRAVVPCPARRWDWGTAGIWGAIDGSHPEGAGSLGAMLLSPTLKEENMKPEELLLLLLLPALRIEPGLVRRLRQELGEVGVGSMLDPGVEADFWSHPDLKVQGSGSHAVLEPEVHARWQRRLSRVEINPVWAAKLAEVLLESHTGFSSVFRAVETLQLFSSFPKAGVSTQQVEWAVEVLERSAESLGRYRGRSDISLIAFFSTSVAKWPAAMVRDPRVYPAAVRIVRQLHSLMPRAPLPAGFTSEMVSRTTPEARPVTDWILSWKLDRLVLRPDPKPWERRMIQPWERPMIHYSQTVPSGPKTEEPLARIQTRGPETAVDVGFGAARKLLLDKEVVELEGLAAADRIRIVTDSETIELERWTRPAWASAAGSDLNGPWAELEVEGHTHGLRWLSPKTPLPGKVGRGEFVLEGAKTGKSLDSAWRPSWASASGRDECGLWAEFEVRGVRHRMRWIPPGRFWMGSPEDEWGRFDDEGPRHEVILTSGFWLGQYPCTQELWQAVMGSNPSGGSKESQAPVDMVSWEECQAFFERLAESGFAGSLPTEAQWEYACRAGTESATYLGDLQGSEEREQILEEVGWYEGNASEGTRQVGLKRPNAWGLFDILGNVWEWCADSERNFARGPVVDPVELEGPIRVFRGGSWRDAARYLRAAFRGWDTPEFRDSDLGFRLSRGPEPGPEAQQESAERLGRQVRDEPARPEERSSGRETRKGWKT